MIFRKIALFFLFIGALYAQDKGIVDSSYTQPDSTQFAARNEVVMSSFLIPGLGQLKQERLWSSTLFYGAAATYYIKSGYDYERYRATNNKRYKNRMSKHLAIAGSLHLVNILDAWISSGRAKGWKGALLADEPKKSPWGAVVRSIMLPGAGQIYNEEYLKGTLYFSLIGALGYQSYWNNRKYSQTGLEKYKDDRSRYNWYAGLAYLLMLTDAYVDAHLFEFDKAVKLSITPVNGSENMFIHAQLSF